MYVQAASQVVSVDYEAENRRLKRELARMTEVRDILNKAAAYFAKDASLSLFACKRLRSVNEVRVRGRASLAVFRPHDVSLPQHPSQRVPRMS